MADEVFIDYYDVLQVDPNCDAKTLESAYHHLAKLYHPDHAVTPDTARLTEVIKAYRLLRSPDRRAKYDAIYNFNTRNKRTGRSYADEIHIDDNEALNDADDHTRILMYLYKRRREQAQDAGVIAYYLKEMLNCSDERFEFHKWYLKEKGFIVITEQGSLAITIQGIDHVISMSRTNRVEQLLIRQSSSSIAE